ncbi:hypothetical protein AB0D32_13995 [Micromonospora sp. NPDC048170]
MSRAHIEPVSPGSEPSDEEHVSGDPLRPEAARTDPADEESDGGYEPL